LKALALALLNATLILVALCLFLAWNLAREVDEISTDFAQSLIDINPVRDDIRDLTFEVASLRADLEAVMTQTGDARDTAQTEAIARLDAVNTRISGIADQAQALLDEPEALVDYAIDATAREMKEGVADLRGCTLPAL
jgi:hypothetical protein